MTVTTEYPTKDGTFYPVPPIWPDTDTGMTAQDNNIINLYTFMQLEFDMSSVSGGDTIQTVELFLHLQSYLATRGLAKEFSVRDRNADVEVHSGTYTAAGDTWITLTPDTFDNSAATLISVEVPTVGASQFRTFIAKTVEHPIVAERPLLRYTHVTPTGFITRTTVMMM